MTTTPLLGIPYIASQQSQPEVTHNAALNMLQILLSGVIDKDLSAPPGAPTEGDIYIIGSAPTGAWSGHVNKLTGYFGGSWVILPGVTSAGTPIAMGASHEGLTVWVKDENAMYTWSGSAWAISVPSFPLSIANGGSGQDTAVEAIDAFSVKGADIASAATTNLAAATGDFVDVTGTTTITALGTSAAGVERVVRFTGILTLTHNATSLILPGGANILTAAGDIARFRSLGTGNWVCTNYSRASGQALISTAPTEASTAEIWAGDLTTKYVSPAQLAPAGAPAILTSGTSITPDGDNGFNFEVTLAHNATLENPTNFPVGRSGVIAITQDGTGSRTLAYGTSWKFPGGAPVLSTAIGAVDLLAYWVKASGQIMATLTKAYSS